MSNYTCDSERIYTVVIRGLGADCQKCDDIYKILEGRNDIEWLLFDDLEKSPDALKRKLDMGLYGRDVRFPMLFIGNELIIEGSVLEIKKYMKDNGV